MTLPLPSVALCSCWYHSLIMPLSLHHRYFATIIPPAFFVFPLVLVAISLTNFWCSLSKSFLQPSVFYVFVSLFSQCYHVASCSQVLSKRPRLSNLEGWDLKMTEGWEGHRCFYHPAFFFSATLVVFDAFIHTLPCIMQQRGIQCIKQYAYS